MARHSRTQSGFTIVELLIVIVVIAILAAITIVAFNGVQDRARNSAAASSSTQAAKKIKVWQVDNESMTPTCAQFYTLVTGTTSSTSCSFDYKDTNYQYAPYTAGAYCVTTTVVTKSYKVSESTPPTIGGCNGHGQGGVAAITNWAIDPNAVTTSSNFGTSGSSVAPSTSSIASDRAHRGSTSLKRVISASATNGTGAKALTPSLTVAASEPLSWSFWMYSTRAGTIIPIAEGNRTSDSTYTNCVNAAVSVPADTWVQIFGSCSVTAAANLTGVGAYSLQVQAGDTVWFDEFMITKGSSSQYSYADGGSANWAWTNSSAPNNSTSTGPPL